LLCVLDKFLNTDLEKILKDKGITTVIAVGQATQGAVITTGSEAAQRGFKVIVAVDGIAAQDDYYEQYTVWHLGNAPLLATRITLTSTFNQVLAAAAHWRNSRNYNFRVMSAFGPKRICASAQQMSAFGGKADLARAM